MIKLELTEKEIQQILAGLGQFQYNQVATIIEKIKTQSDEQINREGEGDNPKLQSSENGKDKHTSKSVTG